MPELSRVTNQQILLFEEQEYLRKQLRGHNVRQDTRFEEPQKKKKQPRKKSYVITPLDYQFLQYVKEYHVLTAYHLTKLHYSDGSHKRAQFKLQTLSGNNPNIPCASYLKRRGLPHLTQGMPTMMYALATDGKNALQEQGVTNFKRFRPSEIDELKTPYLEHTLRLNEVLITGRLLPRFAPDITLDAWMHDLDLKKQPAKVAFERRLKDGDRVDEKVLIVPDGWLFFSLKLANTDKVRQRAIILELDRGTETNIEEFKKKIRAYVHYAYPSGAYEQHFGDHDKRVVYATTAGENRMRTIKKWCEEELLAQRLDHEANLFRFVTLPHVIDIDKNTGEQKERDELEVNPVGLLLSSVAYKPYADAPGTLLWKP